MKHASLIFAALAALTLAACGGNGGTYQGALPDHTAKPTVPDTAANQGGTVGKPAPSQPDAKPATPPAAQNQGIAGYYTKILPGRNAGSILLTGEDNYDINYLMVDGEKISLIAPANNTDGRYLLSYPDVLSYGAVVKNALDKDKRTEYVFVHGKMTPSDQLPTQDKVLTYRGQATFSNPKGIGQGISRFDVNFGKKTLSGEVTADGTAIPITATIEDGQFRNNGGTYVKGAFYGNRGEKLGGMFQSGDTVGAFGAAREE